VKPLPPVVVVDDKKADEAATKSDDDDDDDNAEPTIATPAETLEQQRQRAPHGQWLKTWQRPADDESTTRFLALFEARDPMLQTRWRHVDRLRLMHALLVRDGRRAAVKKLHAELEAWHTATGNARAGFLCCCGCCDRVTHWFRFRRRVSLHSRILLDSNGRLLFGIGSQSSSNSSQINDDKIDIDSERRCRATHAIQRRVHRVSRGTHATTQRSAAHAVLYRQSAAPQSRQLCRLRAARRQAAADAGCRLVVKHVHFANLFACRFVIGNKPIDRFFDAVLHRRELVVGIQFAQFFVATHKR
jgi:hypothetical protein